MSDPTDATPSSSSSLTRVRIAAVWILILGGLLGYFLYTSEQAEDGRFPFRFGLDLTGGTHLVYDADVSEVPPTEVEQSMGALREVIERRVNLFGVSEPLVQTERSSIFAEGGSQHRLIVELPGVTDVDEAVRLIGQTPLLEFQLVDPAAPATATGSDRYLDVGFTGRFIERAQLSFGTNQPGAVNEPTVVVNFNSEGTRLFGEITTENVGEQLAIFLDGELLSTPVINEPITGGAATISGNFTPESARDLVRDLNFGALPVPIELQSTQAIGASLGEETLARGVQAGLIGLGLVALFLLLWYRLPGLVAVVALTIYIALMLALFKLIPVTLTAAGIAGFILSIGMAVDANILIFERLKEELKLGKKLDHAIRDGFARAWAPIRDGNLSSILTAIVLFWVGTSLVQGFALTFGIGVLVSMLTALGVSRTLLLAIAVTRDEQTASRWFGNGIGIRK
ncbi:protein translocase subunit SecD [Patescibacteria group bacterium]|jgi:protein-export membrane protein SecD|nr:protein translocase subunit SecD [Patescibacteria group bacterium]